MGCIISSRRKKPVSPEHRPRFQVSPPATIIANDDDDQAQKIGRGTFSKVFKARDLPRNKTVALKRIRFDVTDSESIKCIAREITILRKLDHPNIIKLEGLMLAEIKHGLSLACDWTRRGGGEAN
ncbi:hypothetical protein F2Q68_00029818 [Brassica cretica]|uniref:Protein kinase domain-containing protein n=1 Tax=Brassica cretica TaxID=69181 RepID=A0A8S9GH83_BRACR|nr:hypothetical protein F2Q68_00029818 [Brassica cretica]